MSYSPQTPTEAPLTGVQTPPVGRGGGPAYGQTPFGGYEAVQGLSPEEVASLRVDIDKGVADRLRNARSIAPSARQQTQGELINLTLLYERLGNPFSVRRLPFSVLRDMTTDPMVNFALHFTDVPLVRAPWYIKCPVAQVAAAVDEALRPVNPKLQVGINGKLPYGYQPMCKRFKLGELKSSYRDPNGDDPEHDIPVWDSNVAPLMWDTPYVLAPEHCMPRWNQRGEFAGFYYSIVPLPNPIQIGLANLYGYSVVPGFEIQSEFAMWPVNEQTRNFGSIYGYPRTARAYRYWWSYWYRWALSDRAFENAADPPRYVYYPTDVPWALDPEDPGLETGTPTIKHLQQLALSMGDQMRSGQTVAWPGDFMMDEQGRQSTHRKWEAGYYDPPVKFDELAHSFSYLDSLKFRCVTADTPIDCPRDHRRFPDGVPISMLKSGDPVWTFNLMTLRFELSPVKAAMLTQQDQPVFKVHLSNGKDIRGTANHPFLTTDLKWKILGELVEGDRLIEFRRDFEPRVKLDPASHSGCRTQEYDEVSAWMGIRGGEEKLHTHHVDAMHANTAVENLQGVTSAEHHAIERTGRRWGAETRRKQSESHLKISDERRAARVSDLHAADDLLLEERRRVLDETPMDCDREGCSGRVYARGLCNNHYQLARYHGELEEVALPPRSSVDFKLKHCDECGREYAPTGSRQYQCQACRYEHGIRDNRSWRERNGHVDETTGRLMGARSGPTPSFEEQCDAVTVVLVEFDGIEDVWDVAIDAPDERKNFISGGVVLHNSMLIPEQAFIEGTKSSSSGSQGGSSRLMGIQLGEVYQESQQMLADENDREINDHMIPQFIASNFPEYAGIPCEKVTEGFGEYDTEIMKQVIQLVGQVQGNVLPVNIYEVLKRMGIPVLTEKQQKQQLEQIAKEAAAMQPAQMPPSKVGMQGYNSGVEKTQNGFIYVQPPQRIDLSTSGQGFLAELPDGVPAYGDASVRASMMRLRKVMLERYKEQVSSFVSMLDQTVLHLAQQSMSQHMALPAGLSAIAAAGTAASVVGAWQTGRSADLAATTIAAILLAIAIRAARRELKQAHLGAEVVDEGVLAQHAQQRASFVVQSIDETIRAEMQTFLEQELQKETDSAKVAKDAEERFADTAETHSERVVLAEALPAYNHGALFAFRDAGVGQVQAHDASDGRDQLTDSECRRINGEVLSVDEAISRAAEEHIRGTLWFSPLSTDHLVVERVPMVPVHLNGHGELAGYDSDKEVLYVSESVSDEDAQVYALAVGEMLRLR
jgi:hypothetical protein